MSTAFEIKSSDEYSRRTLCLRKEGVEGVRVVVRDREGDNVGVAIRRSDLIAALPELGVIVIDKADHASVQGEAADAFVRHGGGIVGRDPLTVDQVERTRVHAEALLLATYRVDTVPPVDEAKVEVLADLIDGLDVETDFNDYSTLARRLLATGRIAVTS